MNKKELKNKEKTKLKSFRDIIQYLYYRFSYFYEKKESPTGAEIRGFSVLGTLFVVKYFGFDRETFSDPLPPDEDDAPTARPVFNILDNRVRNGA